MKELLHKYGIDSVSDALYTILGLIVMVCLLGFIGGGKNK